MKLHAVLAAATILGGLGVAPAFAQATDKPADPAAAKPDAAMPKPKTYDSGFYIGGGINLYFVEKEAAASGMPIQFIDQPSPGAFAVHGGYAFNKYVAVDVEGAIGGAKQRYGSNGATDGKIGMKNAAAIHVVGTLPFGDSGVYALGKLGYATYTLEREYQNVDAPDLKASGPSVGAGLGFRGGSIDYRMDYAYMSSDDGNSGVLGLTIMKRF
jgi:hypothetical protein